MSDNYNPFTEDGRYNIRLFAYEHKLGVILALVVIVFILLLLEYSVWDGSKSPQPLYVQQ